MRATSLRLRLCLGASLLGGLAPACSALFEFDGFAPSESAPPPAAAAEGGDAQPRDDRGLLWSGDLEPGDFSQYDPLDPSSLEGKPVPQAPELVALDRDPAHVREGRFSSRFSLLEGQTRQEVVARTGGRISFSEGDDLYFGFSVFLAPDFQADPQEFCTLAQWATTLGGSSPLIFSAEDDGFKLSGGYGHPDGERSHTQRVPGGLVKGRWTDWVVHVVFSADPSVGWYEVFLDGAPVLPRLSPRGGTLYPGSTGYHRHGLFSSARNTGQRTAWHDGWRIGRTFAAVDPRAAR